jgi:hypothetical protein
MSYLAYDNGQASFPTQLDRHPLARISPNILNEGLRNRDLKRKREPEQRAEGSELGKAFVILVGGLDVMVQMRGADLLLGTFCDI